MGRAAWAGRHGQGGMGRAVIGRTVMGRAAPVDSEGRGIGETLWAKNAVNADRGYRRNGIGLKGRDIETVDGTRTGDLAIIDKAACMH